jgi:glutaredoxin
MSEPSMSQPSESQTRITLYTRAGCHLCDDAKAALDRIGEPWTEVDIAGDPELEADYAEMIPVIMLDGRIHGYFRVESERLVRDLSHG